MGYLTSYAKDCIKMVLLTEYDIIPKFIMKSLIGDTTVVYVIFCFGIFVVSTGFFLKSMADENTDLLAGETTTTEIASVFDDLHKAETSPAPQTEIADVTTQPKSENESENIAEPKDEIDIPPPIPLDAIIFQSTARPEQQAIISPSPPKSVPQKAQVPIEAFDGNNCQLAYEYDWSPKSADMAVRLCHYESAGNPLVVNMQDDHTGWAGCIGSFGLFQINCKYTNVNVLKGHSSASHLWKYSTAELRTDPGANVELAHWYFKTKSNYSFSQWSPCKNNYSGMENCH